MTRIQHVSCGSAFKIGFVIAGCIGLLLGLMCTIGTLAGSALARQAHAVFGPAAPYVGLFSIALCPLFWGLSGGVFAVICALIYNVAADWFGGLEIDTP